MTTKQVRMVSSIFNLVVICAMLFSPLTTLTAQAGNNPPNPSENSHGQNENANPAAELAGGNRNPAADLAGDNRSPVADEHRSNVGNPSPDNTSPSASALLVPMVAAPVGNPAANLDQCGNGTSGTEPCLNDTTYSNWVNGNLGASKSRYVEGDSIPYRLIFTNLAIGSHTVTFQWDTTKSGKHALDYLTTWDRSVTGDPTSGVAGTFGTPTTYPIPPDPQVTGAGVTPIAGNFTLYNGEITAVSGYTYTIPGFIGDTSASITITFTVTDPTAVLAWGGHIATRHDWGQSDSAVAISGSPYHTRLLNLDGSGGNQDRSLSADAVIFPGSITIIKDATPPGATSFDFTASPLPLANFSLVDDGTTANTKVFSDIVDFTTYTVTEAAVTDWNLTGIACSVLSANGGTQKVTLPAVTIALAEGEEVTCTFSNTLIAAPSLSLLKQIGTTATGPWSSSITIAGGTDVYYQFTVTNTGNVALSSVNVTDALVGTASCSFTDPLAVQGETTCVVGPITAETLAGTYPNTAKAHGDYGSQTYDSSESTAEYIVSPSPAIHVVKSSTTTEVTAADQVVPYSFVVTNVGNMTLTGITVSDPNCDAAPAYVSGDTNTDGALQLSESWTYTCSHTVSQAEIDAGGNLSNTVTADSTESEPDTDSLDIPITQDPKLSITKVATETIYDTVGDILNYTIVAKNTGNVTLVAVTVSDPLVSGLSCTPTNGSALAPGAEMSCAATHTVTQADLDAGHWANTACADDGADGAAKVCADEDVPADQNPAITLVKTATPSTYANAGDIISYTLVATNTGNVTLHDVEITDAKLGTLSCTPTQPATLAPKAKLTCTGTYTIQAADLTVFSITNTADVIGYAPDDTSVTATDDATVYRQAGALLPTQTTCQMYAAGPSAWPAMYDAFAYQVKSNKINSVSPGVIFYYNAIEAPSASFTLNVVETNSLNWKPMLIQDLGQAILYNADCSKASGVSVTSSNGNVTFTVTGATAGATYYIGIKYSPQNLIGQPVAKSGGVYPTSIYTFSTTGYLGSIASIPVKPKK